VLFPKQNILRDRGPSKKFFHRRRPGFVNPFFFRGSKSLIEPVSADVIFSGGLVITMENQVEAQPLDVAVANGRILELRNRGNWTDLKGPETSVLDVNGKTLMPGLIDSHNHMGLYGQNLDGVDVSPGKVETLEDLVDKVKNKAGHTPPGQWIKAWGYNDSYLKEKRHPMKEDLDRACPNHPVKVMRTCMHAMAVNSIALKMAGICEKTPDPEGGRIGRDRDGKPNGILYEIGAMDLINRLIPEPDPEDCARFLKLASDVYVREGLSMVTEAGAGWSGNPNEAAGFQVASRSQRLMPRVSMGLMEKTYKLFPKDGGLGLFTGFGDDFLRMGPIKFVADGGTGARTAALSKPYEGSDFCGFMCEDPESLTKRMEEAHRSGFQISVHALGDVTIDRVLGAYESILSRHPRPHRHRIEHLVVCRPDFIPRLKKLGLIAVVQPAFFYYLGDGMAENIGQERISFMKPIKSMLDQGVVVAGSSDRPVTEGNPWVGMWAATQRTTFAGQCLGPEERISTGEALKLWTINGAYANFAEDRVGSLSPGKFADIVVLDENPLGMDSAELKNIKVNRTFINGQEVYRRGDS